MFSFREFLNENHAFGTYASLIPSDESAGLLYQHMKDLYNPVAGGGQLGYYGAGMTLHPQQDYHTTLVYSNKACPEMKNHNFPLPIHATPKEWKQFGNHLVLVLDSPEIDNLHKEVRARYGALHSFPDYIPHVTVGTKKTLHEGLYSSIVTHPKFGQAVAAVHALAGNQEVSTLHPLPSFGLTFHKAEVKPLDPTWKANKK